MSRERVLVETSWVADRLWDPSLVLVEVDERPLVYQLGHIPGSHRLDWRGDLLHPVTRDLPGVDGMRRIWRRLGIGEGSTVVFYGDNSNWYACFGLWLFRQFGLADVRLLDGGRQAWLSEARPMTRDEPAENVASEAPMPRPLPGFRARWEDVVAASAEGAQLLDVRTPAEYRGDLLTEAGYPDEAAQRPGHIPGAVNVPWDVSVGADGRLLPDDDLRRVFERRNVALDRPVITYCRIGERSAHTWFVLHLVLGLPDVRNYDGSWTEWGSMIGMPIALGPEPDGTPAGLHDAGATRARFAAATRHETAR